MHTVTKKIINISLGLGVVLVLSYAFSLLPFKSSFGASVMTQDIIDQIALEQFAYFQTHGEYQQFLKYRSGKYDITVNVYEAPSGFGYTVLVDEFNIDNEKIRETAQGVGSEKSVRKEYDRIVTPEVKTATTT